MEILSKAAESYMATFHGFVHQFTIWGQELFFSLIGINIVWICLWHAFDKSSLTEGMSDFIKKFFVITFFYTIMMNISWLIDILKTVQFMGSALTHVPIDPSSLISAGIALGNKVILPVAQSSLLTGGFGLVFLSITYLIIIFTFISIALDLAVTLIMTSALISVASFFLGFSALGATSKIARETLDVILSNCVKLLGIYLIVAAGSKTITMISLSIPTTTEQLKHSGFDPYVWLIATAVLFLLLARNLPNQLARIVAGSFHETRGADAAALGLAAIGYAKNAMPAFNLASAAGQGVAKIIGSTGYNASAHFNQGYSTGGIAVGAASALGGSATNLGKAVVGKVSDHFKDMASKVAGGSGSQQPINSISERMYQSTKDIKSELASKKEFNTIE